MDQDNVEEPPIQNQEIVTEEQTLQQEPFSLRRSTRERESAIPDDYIILLQEHEVGIGMVENDPINFCQAVESSNSQKWIDVMNEEIKSMKDNDTWDLVPLPESAKPLVENGYLKPKGIRWVMWRDIKFHLSQKASHRKKASNIKRLAF